MINTERLIKNAESKWLAPLQKQCKIAFTGVHLPSHDETHHARVWQHARELLLELVKKGQIFNEKDIEKLIIAVYFHDTGMSVTLQKDHGKISRRIAKDFLKNKEIHAIELDEILDAIEHHDQKEYKTSNVSGKPDFTLQSLLNISDDLDALSFVGAYRYAEIYHLRNISLRDMPDAILANLLSRFQHMKSHLSFSPNYMKTQNQRFLVTHNYFKDLNFQIKQVGDELTSLHGPLGIINFIMEFIFKQNMHVNEACKNALLIAGDFYVTNFFEKLDREFNS